MKCPDCGKTGIVAKNLSRHRYAAHVRNQKAEWAAKRKQQAKVLKHETNGNGNGYFKDAVVGEMARINEEMKKLGVQHDRLSGYLMDYAK